MSVFINPYIWDKYSINECDVCGEHLQIFSELDFTHKVKYFIVNGLRICLKPICYKKAKLTAFL